MSLRLTRPGRALPALAATTILAALACAPAAPAAVVYRGASCNVESNQFGIPPYAITMTKPAGTVQGDVMVATVVSSINTLTPPSGWTQITTQGNSRTWWKLAGASEPASYDWALFTSPVYGAGSITSFGGVDPADPIETATSSAGTGTAVTLPTGTATRAGSYRYSAVGTTSGGPTNVFSAGLTERCDTKANANAIGSADEALASAGAAPARTDTLSTSSAWLAHTVVLNPEGALTASFPAAYDWGTWTPPTTATSAEQAVTVSSDLSWGLKISADRATGRMAEWTGTAYTATQLGSALTWRMSSLGGVAQGTSFAALTGTPALITGSQPAGTGVSVGVTLRQPVAFSDVTLTGGRTYRLQLTYTATQGF